MGDSLLPLFPLPNPLPEGEGAKSLTMRERGLSAYQYKGEGAMSGVNLCLAGRAYRQYP